MLVSPDEPATVQEVVMSSPRHRPDFHPLEPLRTLAWWVLYLMLGARTGRA